MYITRCNTLTHAATAMKRRAADAHKQHAYASACCNTLTHAATALNRRAADTHAQHAYASACCSTLTHAKRRLKSESFFFLAAGLQNEGVARAEAAADAEIMTMTTTAGEMVLQL